MKINYQQSFRVYKNWVGNSDCNGDFCHWYQDKAKFYMDDVKYKEESFWRVIPGILFYLAVMPIVLFIWVLIVLFFKIYNRSVK